ncbi:Pleckstrin homology domain-containing protein [Cytidiella melzeri]|nr:Pleckstrin homology domain-containing protein [Cytidiella melzeri]
MYNKWVQSEWGQARVRRRMAKSGPGKKWIGDSFDVGVFLGVDVINKPSSSRISDFVSNAGESGLPVTRASTAAETFVTAQSRISSPTDASSEHRVSQHTSFSMRSSSALPGGLTRPISADSSTPLLSVSHAVNRQPSIRKVRSELPHNPSGPAASRISTRTEGHTAHFLTVPMDRKGKGKMVHYSEEVLTRNGAATPTPAPPEEVLARSGSDVEDTSAGAAQKAIIAVGTPAAQSESIMRDRMMVQVSFTPDTLGPNFDSTKNRVTPHIQYEDYSEYLVVWRKERLELYKNYSIPGEEWFTGHKQLAFLIPLRNSTKLSLYCFTDFTFAITCPTASFRTRSRTRTRYLLSGSRNGTNIFVFNARSRTRAVDWHWKLWHHLGNALPSSVEVRCPTLDTRLKIDIPQGTVTDEATYAVFTPANIISLCDHVLRRANDYNEVIGKVIEKGGSLELAWRMDTRLDWVRQSFDLLGSPRSWAVLYGLALRMAGQPAHLELRLQEHRLTRVVIKDGTRLDEPSGIEGYLDRIRPNSQMKHAVYLSTHDGYIFFLPVSHANPPPPPGPPDEDMQAEDLRKVEALRGGRQILNAGRMSDLRDVLAVRRAIQSIPRHSEEVNLKDTPEWEDAEGFWENVESFEQDHRDSGGDEGLAKVSKSADKAQLRVRRSFELLFISGRVVRFEAHSCHNALEWISKLRPLVSYWRKRHQLEAKTEMDIVYASTGRPRITPRTQLDKDVECPPDAPPDPDNSSPELSSYYNWCLLEGCRAISKSGKLYGHKDLRAQYQHMQLVLVTGHLVEYHISHSSVSLHRRRVIHLLDAYVCSGYLAALRLPEGQYNPDAPPLPRRYQDGLESDDLDEDTLFMVWWYTGGSTHKLVPENSIPGLNAKRAVSVYRTRSKLERDAWVFAINTEIEKAVRAAREREVKLREAGGLVKRR